MRRQRQLAGALLVAATLAATAAVWTARGPS